MNSPNRNLLNELRPQHIRQEEFLEVLTRHFPTSVHEFDTNYVLYPAEPPHAIRVEFDPHGVLSGVFALALTDAEFSRIKQNIAEEFVETTEAGVGREVFFSLYPVQGCWRYLDRIQILPVPPGAPKPSMEYADHPFLIEFAYARAANFMIGGNRRNRQASLLQLLLNTVLVPHIRWIGHHSVGTLSHHWSLVSEETFEVKYAQEFYWYKDTGPLEALSPTDHFPKITAIVPMEYYRQQTLSTGDQLNIPSDLADTLDRFFALQDAQRDRFLNACYWLNQADRTTSFSVALLAAVQAIEVLLPRPKLGARCTVCGLIAGTSTTKLFNTFLDVFLPSFMKQSEAYRLIYRVRSGLTHGSHPPLMVDTGASFARINPRDIEQRRLVSDALRIARMVLRNWLNCEPFIHDHVALAAYFLWQHDGSPHGNDWKYWLSGIAQLRDLGFLN